MPFAGGLPLVSEQGTLIGAVGVSGAPSQDLEIAEAAVAALTGEPPSRDPKPALTTKGLSR